jgi:hypothetical protein
VTSRLCVPSNGAGQTGASLTFVTVLSGCPLELLLFHLSLCFIVLLFLLLSVFYHGYLTAAMLSRGSIWPAASSPRYSPPNSHVPCGDLSNVRHEVCVLQRTYFVRSCGPSVIAFGRRRHQGTAPKQDIRGSELIVKKDCNTDY